MDNVSETTLRQCYQVMRGGRGRWKIENETFNTLKNQGYQLEHNYGHGQKHLATVFGLLMMLPFSSIRCKSCAVIYFKQRGNNSIPELRYIS